MLDQSKSILNELISLVSLDTIIGIYISRTASRNDSAAIVESLQQSLAFSEPVQKLLENLFSKLSWNEAMDAIRASLKRFDILYIKCLTAIELTGDQRLSLYEKMLQKYEGKYHFVHITFEVRHELLGGLVLELNGKKYDCSHLALQQQLREILSQKLGVT